MTDRCLALLGLARRGGNLAMGEEPVAEACRTKSARVVLLAADAADNTARRSRRVAEGAGVPLAELPHTKHEIGFQLGRSSCAVLAVTDTGLAAGVLARLAQTDPERYGPLAARLKGRAEKRLRRQKETRARAKAREREGRKPWAAPPKSEQGESNNRRWPI